MKKFILCAILLVGACASDAFIQSRGSMPPQSKIDLLEVGYSKNTVRELLGSPSSVSPLDINTWIYMSSKYKKVAFFEPELLQRDILIINFNKNGYVTKISREDEKSGKNVTIATEKTKALGDNEGFFEKAFGTLSPNIVQ